MIKIKRLFSLVLIFSLTNALGQTKQADKLPDFSPGKLEFRIPSFLGGVMKDTASKMINDTLHYTVNGQFFNKGFPVPVVIGTNSPLASPWGTVIELVNAYRKKDAAKIESLYSDHSKLQVKNMLGKGNFLDDASKTYMNPDILGAMIYKNGIIIYIKDDSAMLDIHYLIIENGIYKLSALNDDGRMVWNVGQYLQFSPKPMNPLKEIRFPDSMKLSESKIVNINLTESRQWLTVSTGDPGDWMPIVIEDNGEKDLNPKEKNISFELPGRIFSTKGNHVFYVNSFNYPVYHISKDFFVKEAKHEIIIY